MLFVIELPNLKKQKDTPNFGSAFLHKEMNTSKGGETHSNGYWVFSKNSEN